jgi:hypothetical protein
MRGGKEWLGGAEDRRDDEEPGARRELFACGGGDAWGSGGCERSVHYPKTIYPAHAR